MFLKPDYNLKSIYDINLDELKQKGIKALLFDLDSTLMASKTAFYEEKTLNWLEKVKQVTDFPIAFNAAKPDTKVARALMKQFNLTGATTAFVGDRPLTDTLCGQRLGCTTILVDSISADREKPIVRFVRKLERLSIRH